MIATKSRISDWSNNQLAGMLKRRSQAPEVFRSIMDQGYPGWPSRDSLGSESPLNHYRGEIFAAIRCITQRIAGQPIHVARVVRAKGGGKGFSSPAPGSRRLNIHEMAALPGWVRNKLRLPHHKDFGDRVRAIKSAHSDAVRVDILEYHPLLELLSSPNPRFFQHTLLEASVVSLETCGDCFWWLDDSRNPRKKFDLWPLPGDWVQEEQQNVLLDKGYLIVPPHASAPEKKVRPDRMVYFYYPDPSNPFSPYSPMRAALQAVQIDESIMASQRAGFDNGLFPYLMFIMGDVIDPTGENLGPLQLERWQLNEFDARIRQLYQGTQKHGKYLVGDRFIKDAKFLSHKPHEMDWRESGEYNRDRIWRIMGVPRVIAGDIQDANRATALVADESFTQNTVNPKITMMSAVINDRLLPLFSKEEDIICWIEESVSTDRDAQLKEIELLLANRGIELDEVRADMGRPALPNNMGKVVVSTAMQVFEPVEPGAADSLAQREELLDNENERQEIIEGGAGREGKSFWPFATKSGETFQRIERRFLVDNAETVIGQLREHGKTRRYGVTTLYLDHQTPTWSLGIGSKKIRLRRYESGDTFLEEKARILGVTYKQRIRVSDKNIDKTLVPIGIVSYTRTEYESGKSRVTVDASVDINGVPLGSSVVEVKGEMPSWLNLPDGSECPEFSKSSVLLKGS